MKINKHLKNILITILILAASFVLSLVFKDFISLSEHITTVFVFAVFLISLATDGYVYGIVAALLGALAVNFAFVFPYFSFEIASFENLFSALIMIVISLITSTLTTRLKRWEILKSESEREKMRANLLRAISHDIRTPLTTIYGSSSVILESYNNLDNEKKLVMIKGIKEESEWLIRMVENLLSITRMDSGNVKLIKTPTVIEELIDSVIRKFKKRYPDSALELNIPQDMLIVPMDALLIEQVLVNLLDNAVEHADGMTRVALTVKDVEDHALFEVLDDGQGIAKDKLDGIFTGRLFSSTDSSSDFGGKNAGIGLSVCAAIVKAHGSVIKAENIPGGGARFSFTLPLKEENLHE